MAHATSGACPARTTCSTPSGQPEQRWPATTLTLPRAGQRREALRLLLVARRSAVDVRRAGARAVAQRDRDRPDRLREELATAPDRPADRALQPAPTPHDRQPRRSRGRLVLRTLARRIRAATAEASELERDPRPRPPARTTSCSTSPASARSSPPRSSLPGHTQAASAQKPPSHASPASHRSPPRAAKQPGTDSAAAATANSTAPSTPSPCTVANTTPQPRTTSHAASARARAAATPPASSSATSPDTSTAYSTTRCR